MATPFPGSPGSATIGASARDVEDELRIEHRVLVRTRGLRTARRASASGMPRRSERKRAVVSSGATMPENAPASAAMFVSVARSSTEKAVDGLARVLEDLSDRAAALHVRVREEREHDVLRRDAGRPRALEVDADRGRDLHAHVAREPRARDVRRADPEREAAERPGVRRVRVGSDDDLAGERMSLEDEGMADALARAVEPDALRGRELLLPRREASPRARGGRAPCAPPA